MRKSLLQFKSLSGISSCETDLGGEKGSNDAPLKADACNTERKPHKLKIR